MAERNVAASLVSAVGGQPLFPLWTFSFVKIVRKTIISLKQYAIEPPAHRRLRAYLTGTTAITNVTIIVDGVYGGSGKPAHNLAYRHLGVWERGDRLKIGAYEVVGRRKAKMKTKTSIVYTFVENDTNNVCRPSWERLSESFYRRIHLMARPSGACNSTVAFTPGRFVLKRLEKRALWKSVLFFVLRPTRSIVVDPTGGGFDHENRKTPLI